MSAVQESADELIARARQIYAGCASYADEGTLSTRYEYTESATSHVHDQQLRFRTHWSRPDRFLFEFVHSLPSPPGEPPQEPWMRYGIWTSSGGVRSWWTLKPVLGAHDSLEEALGAAAGVSCGTSHHIASLLGAIASGPTWFPEPGGYRGDPAQSEGAECLRIPMRVQGQDHALWIERGTGLVRRYDECREFSAEFMRTQNAETLRRMSEAPLSRTFSAEDRARMLRSLEEQSRRPNRAFRTHTVTLYRPQLDPVLKPEDFAFVPPDAT